MTKATATPKLDRTIRLRDGRSLAYAEWGDLAGRPVVLMPGAPGSRLLCPDEEATEAAGVRLLTIDRPGYGRSDPRPGRTLLDWPDDFLEFLDALGLSSCPVIGWSGGGPNAIAVALRLPDRVSTLGLAASSGPLDTTPGILDSEGFSAASFAAIELLRRDRPAGIAALRARRSTFASDWESVLAAENFPEPDHRLLARPDILATMKTNLKEAARQGSTGFVDDDVAEYGSWQFSVGDVQQPTTIWCGSIDAPDILKSADFFPRRSRGPPASPSPGRGISSRSTIGRRCSWRCGSRAAEPLRAPRDRAPLRVPATS
jgi:pimeloyl-ACP methyl ester carboxylesterase